MGPVLRILDRLPEQFLVMNGDVLTDLDYSDLMRQHRRVGRAAHGGHLPAPGADRLRGAAHRRTGKVVGFSEKPTIDYRVSMGVYA